MDNKKNTDSELKKRNELALKFFVKTPEKLNNTGYYIFIVLFLVLFISAFPQRAGAGAVQGAIGFIGLLITLSKFYGRNRNYQRAYKLAEPKATDKQMDQWLAEGIEMVIEEARNRLDIDQTDDKAIPRMIDGPDDSSYIGPGADKILRFNRHNILLIFLTRHNVATFKCILDLGFGEILQDKTKEFPYRDITNLETETSTKDFYYRNEKKMAIRGIQQFSLHTSGGNNISVNYIFSKKSDESPDFEFPSSNADDTIKAIRKQLKEYTDKFNREGRAEQ
jgi:hypothetical protein